MTSEHTLSEFRLLVPTTLNTREPIGLERRSLIETAMIERFGGFTVDRGLEGAWVAGDGTIYHDCSDEYAIAATEQESVLAFAHELGLLLQQRSVYVRLPNNYIAIVDVSFASRVKA
jgi:hypothetical protein